MDFKSLFGRRSTPTAEDLFVSGFRHFKDEKYEDAKRDFNGALTLDPSHYRSLICLAQIWQVQGDVLGAISLYRRAIATGARDSDLHLMVGYAYASIDDFENSRQAFTIAIEIDPRNEVAREALSMVQGR